MLYELPIFKGEKVTAIKTTGTYYSTQKKCSFNGKQNPTNSNIFCNSKLPHIWCDNPWGGDGTYASDAEEVTSSVNNTRSSEANDNIC